MRKCSECKYNTLFNLVWNPPCEHYGCIFEEGSEDEMRDPDWDLEKYQEGLEELND